MTLEEIFQTNPELLKTPEVQKLIAYVDEQQKRSHGIWQRLKTFNDRIIDNVMHSEVIVIEGNSSRKVIENILELYEEF